MQKSLRFGDWERDARKIVTPRHQEVTMSELTKSELAINNILDRFPPDMIQRDQWVCWKYDENGRKVPVNPNTATNARVNDPTTWADFDTAVVVYCEAVYDRVGHKLCGLGFVFTEEDSYAGIDLDDCREAETGTLSPHAEQAIRNAGTYAEVSPSGKGVKLYGRGTVPGGGRKWDDHSVEMYSARRWFAVTGEKLDGAPLEACDIQDAIDSILDQLGGNGAREYGEPLDMAAALEGVPEGQRDDVLWRQACKLRRADVPLKWAQKLVCEAAANCRPPFDQGLALEKVHRVYRTYAPATPLSTNGRGSANGVAAELPMAGGGKVASPTHDELRDRWIEVNPLMVWSRDEFKQYSEDSGLWEPLPKEVVEDSVWKVLEEAVPEGVKPSVSTVASVVSAIKARRYKRPDIWDADPDILVTANGVVKVLTGELLDHSSEHYATTGVPYAYDPEAKCPHWMALLEWIDQQVNSYLMERTEETDRWPDDMSGPKVSEMLQEFAGLALTTRTEFEKFVVLVGKRGTGKSTFIEGLQEMVGEGRHGNLNIEDIVGNRYGYARIPGKTLLTGTEQPSVFVKHTNRIEALVSGEVVKVEEKYKPGYDYRPVAKVLWGMNELIKVANGGAGFFRRILVVRFPLALPPGAKDVNLKEKIRAEAPGILNWALAGLKRLLKRGDFDIPLAVQWAIEEFEGAVDIEGRFVEEVCRIGPKYKVRPRGLYQVYRLWCKVTGHAPKTETNVANDWKRLGFKKHPIEGKQYWHGLDIDDDKEESLRNCLPSYMRVDI